MSFETPLVFMKTLALSWQQNGIFSQAYVQQVVVLVYYYVVAGDVRYVYGWRSTGPFRVRFTNIIYSKRETDSVGILFRITLASSPRRLRKGMYSFRSTYWPSQLHDSYYNNGLRSRQHSVQRVHAGFNELRLSHYSPITSEADSSVRHL